jgi:AraC-like DNA-binding protein
MHKVSPSRDDLSEALGAIAVSSFVFCRSDFSAPWGFHVDEAPIAKFHIILSGNAVLTLDDDTASEALAAGELVILPHGTGHRLSDRPGSAAPELEEILRERPVDASGRMSYGGGGNSTVVVCGGFGSEAVPSELLAVLPRVLRYGSGGQATRWLEPFAALLADERADERAAEPGDAVVLAKVADVFLTEFLRQYLASQQPPWVAPLATLDPIVAAALCALRDNPAYPWTLTSLARHVGMSRTAFTAKFTAAIGEAPMAHLARLRLNSGAGYLAATSRTIRDIAREVGYDNEASFSKAFKRTFGQSPGAFRAEWAH